MHYRLLWDEDQPYPRRDKVAFLDPNDINALAIESQDNGEVNRVMGIITNALLTFRSMDYIMLPFYKDDHWILIVIVPKFDFVWYFNSSRSSDTKKYDEVKTFMNRYTII